MEISRKFYQYERFLRAKEKLDSRSMSEKLWKALKKEIRNRTRTGVNWPRRVLDCGCGTGSILTHLSDKGIEFQEYHGIEIQPELLKTARKRVATGEFRKLHAAPEFHAMSVYSLAEEMSVGRRNAFKQPFDIVFAASLAEHVEIDEMLGNIYNSLEPNGLLFMPINYDGVTILEPVQDERIEERLIHNFNKIAIGGQVYEGRVGGNAFCGRKLYHALKRNGFRILDLQSEDWVIMPADSKPWYEDNVKELLAFVVNAVADANLIPHLNRVPILDTISTDGTIGPDEKRHIEEWRVKRLKEIDDGILVFICHQIGALAKCIEVPISIEAI